MSRAEKTDVQLRWAEEDNETYAGWGAFLVVLGLLIEVGLAILNSLGYSSLENWGSVIADTLVAGGVIAEVRFGRLSAESTKELRTRAELRAAVLEKEAASARLELERIKSPRLLSQEQRVNIVSKLVPFLETPFVVSVFQDPEAIGLLDALESVLRSSLWKQLPWQSGGDFNFTRANLPPVGLNLLSGLYIQADISRRSTFESPSRALVDVLAQAGLTVKGELGKMPDGAQLDAIHIVIGKKP